ncbi:type VII secretion protein EccB [Nocardia alni]|uniref:type VII secretion protein EccB n=1 Tax=Nocardia alni TaxID=2815723 RepID=UPI001C24DD99|nr:type VII secretion protein EccB [Nocardia alni]
MPSQLTTRAQVNGYLFLVKRLEHALIRRDIRMLHDPMSVQFRSLLIGAVLGILGMGACAVLGLLHPQGAVDSSHIIAGKGSNALYVIRDGKLYPVLNLASARLIAGTAETPDSVAEDKLTGYPRGPLLGIPGAPGALPGSATNGSQWTLCQTISPGSAIATTVFAGAPDLTGGARALRPDEALLVTNADKTYLLYSGKRAEVDPADDAIVRSLKLQGLRARPVGTALLDATVPVPPLMPPVIAQAGHRGPVPGTKVGQVIEVGDINSTELYVVLADGVQQISPFAAEVIRDADSYGVSEMTTVPPDALAGIAVRHTLPIDDFPQQRPSIISADAAPVACVAWSRPSMERDASLSVLAGTALPLSENAVPVQMAGGDPDPDRADAAYLPPFSGELVEVTDIAPGSSRSDGLCYVSDTGIRYGIPDLATARMLGLAGAPKPAPWEIIGRLIAGPDLTRTAALVARDTLPTGS